MLGRSLPIITVAIETPLKSISVAITQKCNLSCYYCSRDAGKEKEEMSLQEFQQIIASLKKYKKNQAEVVAISGGEPFLHPSFFNFLETLQAQGLGATINSNLIILPTEFLDRLDNFKIYKIVTSLDGSTSETHDLVRGRGNFQRTTENIKRLTERGYRVNLKTVIRKENISELEDIVRLGSILGIKKVGFHRICTIGRAKDFSNDLRLDDYLSILQRCYALAGELNIGFSYDDPLKIFVDPELIKFRDQLIDCYSGCAAGKYMLNIMTDGSVVPCPAFEVSVANIFTSSVEEIFESNPHFKKLRERETHKSYCSTTCSYTKICGGCRARALATHGDMYGNDPLCPINPDNI